jgi:N-acetylmuramoyl-L-alanine amidase
MNWLPLVTSLLLIGLAGLPHSQAQGHTAGEYLKVEVAPGDGVYSLLRRYQLDQHSCNHKEFYAINNLKENATLFAGRSYALPLKIHHFDGRTIRSSIGISDYAVAKTIEEYNSTMLKEGYRSAPFQEDKQLWVPHHLLHCPNPDIRTVVLSDPLEVTSANTGPSNPGGGEPNLASKPGSDRIFPIFGKDHEYVPLKSTKLQGRVYYISTGHGGLDPGAMSQRGVHTLCEDEYAYDVGLRLVRKLLEHGATTYMILRDPDDGIRSGEILPCDTDEVVWGNKPIPRQQKARLQQRANIINELYQKHKKQGVPDANQVAIMIHVDSRSQTQPIDVFFYHHPNDAAGKALAEKLHTTMAQKYKVNRASGNYHGTVTGRDLFMLRETELTSVYIELGNIRNSYDQQRIILEKNREALANWLLDGLSK